jgi:hypothetical protein
MATARNVSMSGINSGYHNKFYMWVDNDVSNWFPTLKNVYRLPFSKWPPQYCTNSTLSDFNDISYVGRIWCPELIPQWHRKISTGQVQLQDSRNNTFWLDKKLSPTYNYSAIIHLPFRNFIKLRCLFELSSTRYDYNLTIMESPKPATDNRFKK